MVVAMKLAIVIPAHNEAKTIREVIRTVPQKLDGVSEVITIVVSDASTDETVNHAKEAGAFVLSHRVNLGAGGATLTGLTAARERGCNIVITLDGDGQHDPQDIQALVNAHREEQADLVIGSRFMSQTITSMPPLKWYGNKVMNGITYLFSGHSVSDSQSGYRLFGPSFLQILHCFSTGGYEFCSEAIIIAHKNNLRIKEVPIRTIYFAERGGQNPLNGLNIFLRLFYRAVAG